MPATSGNEINGMGETEFRQASRVYWHNPDTIERGELQKWYVNFDKCIPFFNEHFGCGICIVVCPWSKPGRGPRIVEQLKRRAQHQKLQH